MNDTYNLRAILMICLLLLACAVVISVVTGAFPAETLFASLAWNQPV